jgi:hypothetical protein
VTDPLHRLSPSGRFLPPGSDASDLPLTQVRYVDSATLVPLAEQTGSESNPYASIAQATADLDANSGGVIYITPGDYSATPAVTNSPIYFVGLAPFEGSDVQTLFPSITCNGPELGLVAGQVSGGTVDTARATLYLKSADLGNSVVTAASVLATGDVEKPSIGVVTASSAQATSCTVFGATLAAAGTFVDCTFAGTLTDGSGGATFACTNCDLQDIAGAASVTLNGSRAGAITAHDVELNECKVTGAVSCTTQAFLRNSLLASTLTTGDDSTIYDSQILGAVSVTGDLTVGNSQVAGLTVTGNLTIDEQSYLFAESNGGVTVGGTLTLVSSGFSKTQKLLAWNMGGVVNFDFPTQAPGIYVLNVCFVNETAPTAGSVQLGYACTAPTKGAVSNTNVAAATLSGITLFPAAGRAVISTGAGANVRLSVTPTGVTGSPSVDVYVSADFQGYGD